MLPLINYQEIFLMELIFNYSTLGEENKVLKGPKKDITDKKFITVQQLSEEASGTKKNIVALGLESLCHVILILST